MATATKVNYSELTATTSLGGTDIVPCFKSSETKKISISDLFTSLLELQSVSQTELGYVNGVTSPIQPQLEAKITNDASEFFLPKSSTDALAPINSIYFSTDASKLVYKDAGAVVNDLY